MNLTQDLDIWNLIVNASLVVKFVMAILLVVSFMSWMFIFQKWFSIRRAVAQTEKFEREFWSGNDLQSLYQGAVNNRHSIGSLERIFEAGFREFAKLRGQRGTETSDMVDGARRAMRATFQREMDFLERHLAFLASTGSVSPYVGLFGTVWGIMHSFRGLSNVQQATLAQVAPGIAEALVATAIGLFAAIPAVVAYNRYSHDMERLANRFESFMEEFSNILHRQPRKRGPMHEINVVPYVDVMLVLLVIFMVTAPLITPGVVDLPSVGKAGQPKVVPLEIVVMEDQKLMVRERDASGRLVNEQAVSRAALNQIIKARVAKTPDLSVLIAGDKNVRYEAVLNVMDDLRSQSVPRVGLQVKPAQR
jgi:biopolymer transport protein TolQ